MNAETIKEIIKTISQELAVPTKELLSAVYELAKAQQISSVTINAIVFILCIIFLIVGIFCTKSESEGVCTAGYIIMILCYAGIFVSFISLIISIERLIVCLNAPQGAAIKALLQMIITK